MRIFCQEKLAYAGANPDREWTMNQKLENLLNLALETPEAVRLMTDSLNVGFDSESRRWELIVKYHGSLDGLEALGVSVEYLINSYAILTVPEQLVETVSNIEEIEYVEKPKRYYYQDIGPAADSCMTQVTLRDPFLSGEGVLVAVLDSGIDYTRPEFQDSAGKTRILYLWDQTMRPEAGNTERQPPVGYVQGVEFTAEQINLALETTVAQERYMLLPSVDVSGHGTAVAGIAAGCYPAYNRGVAGGGGSRPAALGAGAAGTSGGQTGGISSGISGGRAGNLASAPGFPGSQYRGAAPAASLLVVKLGLPGEEGFPRTTEIMRGVTYALQKAAQLGMPLVINLSFGNTYGSHDGGSLLERFLDNAAEIGRTVICVGSGNEGNSAGHVAGSLFADEDGGGNRTGGGAGIAGAVNAAGNARPAEIQLAVAEYERSLSIQLWKNYSDIYRIYLRSPGGQEAPLPESVQGGKYTLQLEQTQILVYMGNPLPYAVAQEIYLELIVPAGQTGGGRQYINSGVWTIRIEPVQVVTGQYYLYLPSYTARSSRSGFYRPTPQVTLTIPSTAAKVITVGAYDSTYDSYADFSGRGYVDAARTIGVISAGLVKPDLAAPGVGILAPDLYGGYSPFTGTSFATPIVSGSAALLMEWGIVRGNDPFLYGEKVKAYLRKGARPLRGEGEVPNDRVGWGALCVVESLPV